MATICKHFIVSGLVQGVFFRYSTRKKAIDLNLTGWVGNREDGDVELVACGDEKSMQLLEDWLWQGPPAANVTLVTPKEHDLQEFKEFLIKK